MQQPNTLLAGLGLLPPSQYHSCSI